MFLWTIVKVALKSLIAILSELNDETARKIVQILLKFIGKTELVKYLKPVLYRLQIFYFLSQGYCK